MRLEPAGAAPELLYLRSGSSGGRLAAAASITAGFVVETTSATAVLVPVPAGHTAAGTIRTLVWVARMLGERGWGGRAGGLPQRFPVYEQPLVLPQFRHL